jgi:S-adenosylmethionine-diacylgycerolhomoserine-N-methlytransferase
MSTSAAAAKMDGIYRYQRFIYDATRRYYLLGRNTLIAGLNVPAGGSVLEVGCGTARNLVLAGRAWREARLYGFDVSEEMLRTARASVRRAGLEPRTTLAAGDATAFAAAAMFGVATFDRVFISYALSMIPAWRDVVTCSAACVAPGGELHVVDFGDFASYPGWAAALQRTWLRRFSVTPIPGLETELAGMASQLGLEPAVTRAYGGYTILARLRRPAA